MNLAMSISSVTIVAGGVAAPIRMATYPAMETCQPVRSGDQPDITGSQIEVLVPHQTDVFDAIPSVSLGNHNWFNLHGWSHHHGWRKLNGWQPDPDLSVWLNHTP